MSTQLDPVTGLPVLAVPDVISQIPLSKQVVPWEDIGAISRPERGPAYPNDILNTLAYITGESVLLPGKMRAGTFTEDRRFRVDPGAGFGGSPIPVTHSFADTAEPGEATGYVFSLGVVPTALMGFTASYMEVNYNGPDSPQHVAFWLQGETTGKVLDLGRFAIAYDGNPVFGLVNMITRDWSPGLSLAGFFPGDTSVELAAIMNTVFGTISWTLLCTDQPL